MEAKPTDLTDESSNTAGGANDRTALGGISPAQDGN